MIENMRQLAIVTAYYTNITEYYMHIYSILLIFNILFIKL